MKSFDYLPDKSPISCALTEAAAMENAALRNTLNALQLYFPFFVMVHA